MQININGKEILLKEGSTVLDALKSINANPESVIVKRKDEILLEGDVLNDGDELELIKVISGG